MFLSEMYYKQMHTLYQRYIIIDRNIDILKLKVYLEECKNLCLDFLIIKYRINKVLKIGMQRVFLSHILTFAETNCHQRQSSNNIFEILFF